MKDNSTGVQKKDKKDKFVVKTTDCSNCGYNWVAVYPESAQYLDCPKCETKNKL